MNAWDINPNPNGYAALLKSLRQWWQVRKARREQKAKTETCPPECHA